MPDAAAVNFYEFGKFRLDAERCVLFDSDNTVVDVTPKALEILCVLVESGGRLVSKDELIKRVWAESFVEEANLSHHIFRLRRALGGGENEKFIETVSKRGYRFVALIETGSRNGRSDSDIKSTVVVEQQSPSRIKRYLKAASATAISLVILTGAYLGWNGMRPADDPRQSDSKFKGQSPMSLARVTNGGTVVASSISPDGRFVAYAEPREFGKGTIYLRQRDTNTEIQLLEDGDRNFGSTAFSADGTNIFYVVFDKRDTSGALYRIPVLGGRPEKVLSNIDYFFTLSSDGKYVAFYRSNGSTTTDIIIASLDGSAQERTILTFDWDKASVDGVPAFSPDGKRLAFVFANEPSAIGTLPARGEVFTVEISSGEIKKLSQDKWLNIGMMNWMPDASGVVFVGRRERGRNQMYFLSYPEGQLAAITNDLSGYGNYGIGITADGKSLVADTIEFSSQMWSISANGKARDAVQLTNSGLDGARGLTSMPGGEIVYTSRTGSDDDLWKLTDVNGRREGNPLVSDDFYQREPIASPDGSYILFGSDRAGGEHIFRVDADGSNLTQITFGEGLDSVPDISSDGRWIVYTSYLNNQNRIRKMPSIGGTPIQLTNEESVAPAFSPDGRHVSYVSPSESRTLGRLNIVSAETGSSENSFQVIPFDFYVVTPRWAPDSKSILFRRTDTLVGNLWKQDLSGGQPTQFTDFASQKLYYFTYSRNYKDLLISRGSVLNNVVMLKNFRVGDG